MMSFSFAQQLQSMQSTQTFVTNVCIMFPLNTARYWPIGFIVKGKRIYRKKKMKVTKCFFGDGKKGFFFKTKSSNWLAGLLTRSFHVESVNCQ
jgi:hypothetical protein